ncbi:MAG TPA: amidohydrolase family protein [Ramlibacter sp.]|nr:amidohydrolase family protein [Ramlibacter sp.]
MSAAAGAWDCHAHVFGPYEHFPLAAERSYTPPEAPEAQYLELLRRLGMSHGVLIHPSAYGDDHALLLHMLQQHANLRGVVTVRPDGPLAVEGLRDRGVRAARFMHRSNATGNFAGSASLRDLQDLAPALADAGLHAELWTDCQALPDIAPVLRTLPLPVVIDHMAMFDLVQGLADPGFRVLLDLVASGKVWVKLCAYRNLLNVADPDMGRAFQQALVQANPERLVWGSDWPFLRVNPAPDAGDLLEIFKRWAGSEQVVEQVLLTNPAALYS